VTFLDWRARKKLTNRQDCQDQTIYTPNCLHNNLIQLNLCTVRAYIVYRKSNYICASFFAQISRITNFWLRTFSATYVSDTGISKYHVLGLYNIVQNSYKLKFANISDRQQIQRLWETIITVWPDPTRPNYSTEFYQAQLISWVKPTHPGRYKTQRYQMVRARAFRSLADIKLNILFSIC